MHGRKKSLVPPSQTEIDAIKRKMGIFTSLVDVIFERKATNNFSEETLGLTSKLLASFPDFYSMWNFRREILISLHNKSIGMSNNPTELIPKSLGQSLRDEELALSSECIKKNPKSYGAWFHRKWILQRFETDYDSELLLCREFLKLDQRNFHCWNYRRYVASLAGKNEMELEFSKEKILENFSNYSAFHHRSVYIFSSQELPFSDVMTQEIDIIENAVFTEPDDQSAWWYLHFVVTRGCEEIVRIRSSNNQSGGIAGQGSHTNEIILQIERSLKICCDLIELEPMCKLALNLTVNIYEQLHICDPQPHYVLERMEILKKLEQIDPRHKNRYVYLMSKQ